MDFTRSEVTNEEYLPDTALRSEQSTNQQTSGRMVGGIPGAVSNTPPNEAELQAEEQTKSEGQATTNSSSSMTRNYEVSRRIETRQPQTAQIMRVHAAVLLHELPAALDENGQPIEAPQTPPMDEIEALAKSAIGFNMERGDVVTVTSAPFVATASLIPEAKWYEASWLPDLGRILAQLAILGIIVLGVVRPLLDRLLPSATPEGAATGSVYGDAVEVPKGESLSSLRQRIETSAPDADDLNDAITYEEKIELLRHMTSSETNRIAGAFKAMLAPPNEEGT
jgi:flagellar M-ring protein FliF